MKMARTVTLFFLMMCFIKTADARWANKEDLDTYMESYNRDIYVYKDGTYRETIELSLVAIKESGKDRLVSFPLVYNAASDELKILEAKTILNGIEYPVDLTHIEDKPLASSPQGFDQKRQILIAFPEVALNAKVYLKYQTQVKEVPVPGFFSTNFVYGEDSFWEKSHVHVDSELPFYVEAQDKENVLDIQKKNLNGRYQMDIVLKKPTIKVPIDEKYMALDSQLFPWVTLSTLQTWPTLGKMIVNGYEAIINQTLPPLLEKISTEAKTKSTIIEKINTVTARLSENITYMGDWRTIKGAYVPRPLNEIIKTKIGDCKDFSAMTVAILRKLGIQARVALVGRGGINTATDPNHLPNLAIFNHAFVQVQEGNKILWIDPTNFSSFAQGIYPDVADRKALVLDPLSPILLQTPTLNAKDSSITFLKEVFLPEEASDVAHMTCKISLSGVFTLPLVGADLRFSKESINHGIISAVTDESRVVKWEMGEYNLTSRIVSDLNFQFNFTEKNTQMKTTAGNAFLLPSHWQVSRFLAKTEDRVTDLFLDDPGTYHYETILPKKSLVGKDLACQVDSIWFKGSRKITNTSEGIRVLDELIIQKERILNRDLQSKEYAKFQSDVFSCFGNTALVYKH